MKNLCAALLAIVATGCGLPEAPAELSDLCTYLYAHHADEDSSYMESGLLQLDTWLEKKWDPEELSYEDIAPITNKTADSLDGTDRLVEDQVSMAVITESTHTLEEVAYAMLAVSESQVYPDMFVEYERTPYTDLQCFLDHECDRAETKEHMKSEFAFGVETESSAYNEYLWVETDNGPAFVQRNWLIEPPVTNSALLECDQQYYMNLFTPRYNAKKDKVTGFYRLQATWLIASQEAVSDDLAKLTITNSMEDNSEQLDVWLDENCHNGRCD